MQSFGKAKRFKSTIKGAIKSINIDRNADSYGGSPGSLRAQINQGLTTVPVTSRVGKAG